MWMVRSTAEKGRPRSSILLGAPQSVVTAIGQNSLMINGRSQQVNPKKLRVVALKNISKKSDQTGSF